MTDQPFAIGDVVRLNSSGPDMTVVKVTSEGDHASIMCRFMASENCEGFYQMSFDARTLTMIWDADGKKPVEE